MSALKVGVIVGSIRKESFNRKLTLALARLAPEGFVFDRIGIENLPFFSEDREFTPDPAVVTFKRAVGESDALLFATPEYNRSFSGTLKNALDVGSRPRGESVWSGKPAGVVGVALGAMGTAMAQQHLRGVLSFLNMPTLPQPEVYIQYKEGLFDTDGNIGTESRDFLQTWMDSFVAWIRMVKG
ncbi:MAG: NAD(P)H-dependent oxidoreductase [Kiritimatiellaeota bacterium]|nr:NAD(P)H-dependent oxidoreductase [Kiritimatiellota bacterium]